MFQMKLDFFTDDKSFPFYISYGAHQEDFFVHSHEDFNELVVVLNGKATHLVNDEEFQVSKGDVFIIGADTSHGYAHVQDFQICNLMFQHNYFFQNDFDIKKTSGFQALFVIEPLISRNRSFHNMLKLDFLEFEKIKRTIADMIGEYTKKEPGYKTLLTGSFYQLATTLSRLYSKTLPHNENHVIGMAESIAYLENHYMEDLTVDVLAKIAGFSPRHFSRRFYEITKTTPLHYILMMRMQKAEYYLSKTDLPISTIAAKCGFSDSNYFSRLYKKYYQINPSNFRRISTGEPIRITPLSSPGNKKD